MYNIEEELKKLPDKPGIYIMKNKDDEIIYVGKANSLKKRVRQYFQSSNNQHAKVRAMVKHISEFEYIIVDSELEALVLEANYIKKNRPKYNILLRDDKQYPYIKISLNERYPRVIKTRRILKDGAKYFGPYPNATAVNDAIDVIINHYQIRTCKLNLENNMKNFRPCLNYFIGRCGAPCLGNVDEKEYMKSINHISRFLSNRDDSLITAITEKMNKASQDFKFEEAARYRDQINALVTLKEKQKMVSTNQIDQDVIAMARGIEEVCIQIFFIRDGKIIGREHYIMEDTYNEARGEILSSFVKQFYIGSAYIPKEIIIENDVNDLEPISTWLSNIKGSKVSISVPKRGDKLKLVEMVRNNARDMLNKHGDKFIRKYRENMIALEEIQNLLELEEAPKRIEAYDISNINGVGSVGSMVVFESGEAKKSDYRRFRIKTINTSDDYGSMEEVLRRRFTRGIEEKELTKESDFTGKGFSSFPDLIMIDGGKGQVNIVIKVLEELGVNLPVSGLVKDDFHRTRGIIYNNREHRMDKNSRGFKLVYRIQEEAHRFAISYHRSLRSKNLFKSELDDIKGVGNKRKLNLMKHFKSIEKIKTASVEELAGVSGMNRKVAEEIFNKFNRGD